MFADFPYFSPMFKDFRWLLSDVRWVSLVFCWFHVDFADVRRLFASFRWSSQISGDLSLCCSSAPYAAIWILPALFKMPTLLPKLPYRGLAVYRSAGSIGGMCRMHRKVIKKVSDAKTFLFTFLCIRHIPPIQIASRPPPGPGKAIGVRRKAVLTSKASGRFSEMGFPVQQDAELISLRESRRNNSRLRGFEASIILDRF